MQHFLKYEVAPSTWTTLKKKIQKTDEDGNAYWNPELVAVVVELGKLCIEKDKEGNCIKQATKESVDIVWNAEPLSDFKAYEIWCQPVGVSSMGYTLDTEYTKAYCEKFPDYCKPPVIDEID